MTHHNNNPDLVPDVAICNECDYPYMVVARCQNPACFPGRKAYVTAHTEWTENRERYVRERLAQQRVTYSPNALREVYAQNYPEPKPPARQ